MADKLRKASSTGVANVATVISSRAVGETTLSLKTGGLLNWSETTDTDFTTYKIVDGVITSKADWIGRADVDNDLITGMELINGTDVGNEVDDIVICVETSSWVNDVIDTLLTIFDQTGSLKANSIASSNIINEAISTTKLADSAVTIGKMAVSARQQVLDVDGSTEIVYSTAATQPTAQAGKTIIWFAPSA